MRQSIIIILEKESSNRLFSFAWRNPGFFYAILKEVTTDGG
nr:MAG TPA: hypothetical protein [Caudoviricetes sp.]